MESLFELYNRIYNEPMRWNYYPTKNLFYSDNKNLRFCKHFGIKFIRDYLKAGEKDTFPRIQRLNEIRLNHTLSSFFLGIELYQSLGLDDMFNGAHLSLPDFRYYWFLLCLLHDIGYIKEENTSSASVNPFTPNEITNKMTEIFRFHSLPASLQKEVNYSPQLLQNYYEYIICSRNHCDHGIVGAIDFFDGILSHHNKLINKYGKVKGSHFSLNGINIDDRNVADRFGEIASLIAIHNIWMQEDKACVRAFSLDELIGKHLKVSRDAILFWILVIVDAIEPLKRCLDTKQHHQILKRIRLSSCHNRDDYNIILDYDSKYLCLSFVNSWVNGIKGLKEWTNICVEERGGGISISFRVA